MKTSIALGSAAFLLITVTVPAGADIIAGPITNPANGHDYYLLMPNTWSVSETEAETLGGTLAVINDEAEQKWVFSTFAAYGDTNRNLWIGLRRQWPGGPFAWVTGEKLDYVNWHRSQPDNGGGVENCAHLWCRIGDTPGAWNDCADNYCSGDDTPCGVVEVPGKSNPKALTEKEKSLIGTWFENGNGDRPCWIAGAENVLFAIDPNRNTSRVILTPKGDLFSAHWKQHAEIVKDKILWSKGNWWSRKPAAYKSASASPEKGGKDRADDVQSPSRER